MSAATIIRQAASDGVTLTLAPSGTIRATGDRAAVARWAAMIRDNKPGIVALLQQPANDQQVEVTPVPVAEPEVHQRWTVAIPGRDVFGVIVPQGATFAEMRAMYPTATSILAEPQLDHYPATAAEANELRQLIDRMLPGAPPTERAEALRTALTDVQDALTCYRALVADRGGL